MLEAVEKALPADIADLCRRRRRLARRSRRARARSRSSKAGRRRSKLIENPDILSTIAHRKSGRPRARHRLCRRDRSRRRQCQGQARARRAATGSSPTTFRRRPASWAATAIRFTSSRADGVEAWPPQSKDDVARMLIERIAAALEGDGDGGEHRGAHHAAAARRRPAVAGLPKRARRRPRSARRGAGRCARRRLRPAPRALIPTGIAIALPPGHEGQVRPRSGLAVRHGVTVLNTPGTIDADYRGELQIVIVVNSGSENFVISRGMRIAQLVIAPILHANLSLKVRNST